MKVLALGGSGDVGQIAVKTILKSPKVDQVVVAARSVDRATNFVKSLEDERVSARGIDVEDIKALTELMSEADVIMNTVGPFYRFGIPILRAAIKAGRHYADIMDDYGPAQEALALDEEARQAGVTALICMGTSPGVTNVLARHAANQLDEVDYIQTSWGYVGGIQRPRSALARDKEVLLVERISATWAHFLYCASWKVPVFRDGKFVEVTPLEDGEEVTFPNGKGFFRYYGHSEPVTLPRFIKGLKGACSLVGQPGEAMDVLRELAARVRAKELSPEEGGAMYLQELFKRRQQRPDEPVDMGPRVGGWYATAAGKKGGKRVRYGYGLRGAPSGGLITETGIPFALAAEMIVNGEMNHKGVLAPEACIDPLPFLKRYMSYWVDPPETAEQGLTEVIEEI